MGIDRIKNIPWLAKSVRTTQSYLVVPQGFQGLLVPQKVQRRSQLILLILVLAIHSVEALFPCQRLFWLWGGKLPVRAEH